jgi:hypothetical protein
LKASCTTCATLPKGPRCPPRAKAQRATTAMPEACAAKIFGLHHDFNANDASNVNVHCRGI